MTARELRLHLADAHHHPTRGLMWPELVELHDGDHRAGADHEHESP